MHSSTNLENLQLKKLRELKKKKERITKCVQELDEDYRRKEDELSSQKQNLTELDGLDKIKERRMFENSTLPKFNGKTNNFTKFGLICDQYLSALKEDYEKAIQDRQNQRSTGIENLRRLCKFLFQTDNIGNTMAKIIIFLLDSDKQERRHNFNTVKDLLIKLEIIEMVLEDDEIILKFKKNMIKYSAVNTDEEEAIPNSTITSDGNSLEQLPLLGESITIQDEVTDGHHKSCKYNYWNWHVGHAIASVGLVVGSVVILYAGFTSCLGLYFLSRVATHTNGRNASFFAVSQLTYASVGIFFDLAIAIKCFGVSISYLMITGDLMPEVVKFLLDKTVSSHFPWLTDRTFWISVAMIFIVPLSFLKRLDSLKHTSSIALIAVVYLIFIVIYYYFAPDYDPPPKDKIHFVNLSSKFFSNLPIFIFSFTCHQNLFTIYNELEFNNQRNINNVIITAIGTSAIVYQIIGIFGYLSFGDDVLPNIISEYNAGLIVTIGRIAIVILVIFSYPLQAHPARACLDKVLTFRSRTTSTSPTLSDNNNNRKIDDDLLMKVKYIFLTSGILISSYTIAISVTKLDLVFAFVGSTGSTTISFILPGIFYYKIHQNDPWDRYKIGAALLALYGFLVMIICLTLNVERVSAE
ncbi:2991_t:CDS:10 [Entrophospora sp. SA101]|nr:2991_t:CDS:10 [Entrophospora sp. SA101]